MAARERDHPQRAGVKRRPARIEIAAYDNLAAICWNRRDRFISGKEAFRLYERIWRFVDQRRMKPAERALIELLAQTYGNGVLNVCG